eukprot:8526759-Karenia_brevis.AAC.1
MSKALGAARSDFAFEKLVPADTDFIAWGTQVISHSGEVATPKSKRGQLITCGAILLGMRRVP